MSRPVVALFLLLAVALTLTAQAPKIFSISDEPNHRLILENSAVRVFGIEVPGQRSTAKWRADRNYLVVSLEDSSIAIATSLNGTPLIRQFVEGDMWFYYGRNEAWSLHNREQIKPYRDITVEFLQPGITTYGYQIGPGLYTYGPQASNPPLAHDIDYDRRLDLQAAMARSIQRLPGHSLDPRTDGRDELLIAVSDIELELITPGSPARSLQKSKGEVEWLAGGAAARIGNRTKQPARFVLITFR